MESKTESGENQDRPERPSLFERIKRRFAGDVIAADIGEEARGVAVGKNIIQIGTLVIPTLPILALILLVGSAFAYLALRPQGPKVMSGEFNLAVAQFGQIQADGSVKPSQDGERLSKWLFDHLQTETDNLAQEINIQVWHDSLPLGVRLGIIPGDTAEARGQAAAALAEKIEADILIYGNIDVGEDPANFTPEFHVSALPEAEEIVGEHRLGAPIDLRLPLDDLVSKLQFNQELRSRATALTYFTIGLAWEFAGDPQEAMDYFQRAAALEDWSADEGKEIVHLFIGRSAFFLWKRGEERAEEVRAAFEQALALNPDYARAHIGMGNYYGELAQRLLLGDPRLEEPGSSEQVHDYLDQAIAEYLKAFEGLSPGEPAHVRITADLALAGAYRLKGNTYLVQGDREQAGRFIDLAIESIQEGLGAIGEEEHRYLAQAYLGLGTGQHLKAHLMLLQENRDESKALFERAGESYTLCIQHADAQPYDWFIESVKEEFCTPYLQDVQEAIESF